jgi:alkylhydroperoxidase/carboxymuconolactone decarboxylase family protein YurZ
MKGIAKMARPDEIEVAKQMKAAKTAEEMVRSWTAQAPGRDKKEATDSLRLYMDKKPEMIATFAHNQLTQVSERGILDRKTRYLITIGIYMALRHWHGLLPQCSNAKAAGATNEEIMEVAFLANYGVSKTMLIEGGEALANVFEDPAYQQIKKRE